MVIEGKNSPSISIKVLITITIIGHIIHHHLVTLHFHNSILYINNNFYLWIRQNQDQLIVIKYKLKIHRMTMISFRCWLGNGCNWRRRIFSNWVRGGWWSPEERVLEIISIKEIITVISKIVTIAIIWGIIAIGIDSYNSSSRGWC